MNFRKTLNRIFIIAVFCCLFLGSEKVMAWYIAPNTPPVLSFNLLTGYFGIMPEQITESDLVTFRVNYSDYDGDIPRYVRVIVDGDVNQMTADIEPCYDDYYNGGIYSFSAGSFSVGQHNFYFETSDGSVTTRFPLSGSYSFVVRDLNIAPTLSFDSVTGETGVSQSTFFQGQTTTFMVNYRDENGDIPEYVRMTIDGNEVEMIKHGEGDYFNWQYYEYTTTTLSVGEHEYFFEASDGNLISSHPGGNLHLIIKNSKTPVILIPGIAGTELSKDGELIWMNLGEMFFNVGDSFLDDLKMDDFGNSKNEISVKDLIRKKDFLPPLISYDYFNGLVMDLVKSDYVENKSLFVFPYDWRIKNEISSEKLNEKINEIKLKTGSSKIDVVAHSMGGLVLKEYVARYGRDNLNKVIFVGTPQTGSPDALKTLLFGTNFGIPFLESSEIKGLVQNMPTVYELLPSSQYVSNGAYLFKAGHGFSDYEVSKFIVENGYNSILLNGAKIFQKEMDSVLLPEETYNIVGCGKPTLGEIQINGNGEYDFGMVKGDGTVPLKSATAIAAAKTYFVSDADHPKMPSQKNISETIVNILENNYANLGENISLNETECNTRWKIVSIFSPVDPNIVDSSGNHTGYNSDGQIEENIPGSRFEVFNGEKMVILPDNGNHYSLKLNGTSSGNFTLRVSDFDGRLIKSTIFYNIPVNQNSVGQIQLDEKEPTLIYDANGSGQNEYVYPSSVLNGDKVNDIVPPSTVIEINGTKGDNGWFKSNVVFTLLPKDDNSGILSTDYSLDGGATWKNYKNQVFLDKEGLNEIFFKSVDRAGNVEEVNKTQVSIDKTPPEASIYFDQYRKDLEINGLDEISSTTVSDMGEVIKINDRAGNYLEVLFLEKDRKRSLSATLVGLNYNGESFVVDKNKLDFLWKYKSDKLDSLTQKFQEKNECKIFAEFSSKSEETRLRGLDVENGKIKKVIKGLKLLKIQTNKGELYYHI